MIRILLASTIILVWFLLPEPDRWELYVVHQGVVDVHEWDLTFDECSRLMFAEDDEAVWGCRKQ